MNPNQKIITIGSISLGLVVLNILLHIVSITVTVLVLPGNGSNGSCNETVIREYNETVRVEKVTQWHNTNVIEYIERPENDHFMNNTEALCDAKGFAPFSKDNGIRIGSRGHVFVIREPFVSCSPTECRTFFLTQGSLLNDKHSNGTVKDRSPYRTLMSVEIGQSPNVYQARFEAVAWSATACHDGKKWMTIGVTGPDAKAVAVVHYGGIPTDVVNSWAGDILRTQESSCTCIQGECFWVMTDGPANKQAQYRAFKAKQGKIVGQAEISFNGGHIEECSCYPNEGKVECVCRDNWTGTNRPVLVISPDLSYRVGYLCAGLPSDTPRGEDSQFTGSCTSPMGNQGYGVKGFGFRQGNDVWMGRTISRTSRSGFEILKVRNGWVQNSKEQIKRQVVVDNLNWSGYSGSFTLPVELTKRNCLVPCFWVEMIRGKPEEKTIWTSSSSIVMCGVDHEIADWSWHDGAILPFDIDKM
ncbi:neuraminidase [Influenza A virus (A/green-winged teal/Interior Alaska/6MP0909/2006(H3N8))]|uniref:Neuraminidase n=3 Tax=H3N8 subtype TaxID=119211 RepID=E8YXA7_9INFA|nr:neuraminidase [Influenza A virus (A/green-winged teal/Interior Alaska/6MP0909/2006(H3N8))]ADU16458.1 neuraminidase [Influenza A virus (A/green-winged teal/Interior Alaska/6MP1077/2006(H3N8))]ADU16645.1 neuraminidase [Influenza A virus (A/mallard/Interior Alaska/6MP0160AR1/2006(H3N8))]